MGETEKTLVRMFTSGSVDDGKSTLLGHLLVATGSVYEDQLKSVEQASLKRGFPGLDYSLILDGLSAEREQRITIDISYRYFETSLRRFIVADCPGHVQYTRNMVSGASGADLAVLLLDAERGIQEQTRRHAFVCSLLRIPHVVVAVNKMDLVDFDADRFEEVCRQFQRFASKLELPDITFIPVCAVAGDNLTSRSERMPWYQGASLLHYLENTSIKGARNLIDFRFPVQWVNRPGPRFRGYSGRVFSGAIRRGEEVVVLPSAKRSRIRSIVTFDGELEEAAAPQSVTLTLEDELDIGRGDMIVRAQNRPALADSLSASLCWFSETPSDGGRTYLLKCGTRETRARLRRVQYVLDVGTLRRRPAETFHLNDIGRGILETVEPICFDPYRVNRTTGSFILMDPDSGETVAAGMILSEERSETGASAPTADPRSSHLQYEPWSVTREMKEERNGHGAAVFWFTGLPGSGKSTLAREFGRLLFERGLQVSVLDGDQMRGGLNRDLGFTAADRGENLRRAAEVARLFFEAGNIVLCAFVSPGVREREFARSLIPRDRFFEVHVKCSVETCRSRDPKGHYAKADRGEIPRFTGVSAVYEPPTRPELILDTENRSVEALVMDLEALVKPLIRIN